MLSTIYNQILFQPLLNALILLYNFLGRDLGLAIIALTVIIRLILYPSFKHQIESQKKLTELQPKVNELKEKYKNDKEQQSRALMDLYKQNKVNPFSSCLPTIIQIIVLLAMYQVFSIGLKGENIKGLYTFVSDPGLISSRSFGFLPLTEANLYLAVFTGLITFVQGKMMAPKQNPANQGGQADFSVMMSKQMIYFLPVITVVIGAKLPAGLVLYWFVTTLFSIIQQYFIIKANKQQVKSQTV